MPIARKTAPRIFCWSKEDIAWVSGVLEGEGTFLVNNRTGKRSTGRGRFAMCHYSEFIVRCSMSDEDVIRRLRDTMDIGTVTGPYLYSNSAVHRAKPMWNWSVSRFDDVKALLVAIRPFMGKRRGEKIDSMLVEMNGYVRYKWGG